MFWYVGWYIYIYEPFKIIALRLAILSIVSIVSINANIYARYGTIILVYGTPTSGLPQLTCVNENTKQINLIEPQYAWSLCAFALTILLFGWSGAN